MSAKRIAAPAKPVVDTPAARAVQEVSAGSFVVRAFRGRGRRLATVVAVLVLLTIGLVAAWRKYGPAVESSSLYQFDPREIRYTPPPAWVRSDVLQEVIRDGGLEKGLNLLERDVCEQVAKAFALNPRVREVVSVARHGAGWMQVELVYRQPACMVEVPGGLFAVDVLGVLLPSADFAEGDALRYPRLTGIAPGTWGPPGVPWRDQAVLSGAAVAAVLAESWRSLNLKAIAVAEPGETQSSLLAFDLITSDGDRILWGSAPGEERQGEAKGQEKLARLKALLAAPRPEQTEQIDLRVARKE